MLTGVALPPTVVCSNAHISPTQWSLSTKGRTIRELIGGEGGGAGKGRSTKNIFAQGKLNEKKFMRANER